MPRQMNLEMCKSTPDRVYLLTLTTNAQIAEVIMLSLGGLLYKLLRAISMVFTSAAG